jgi:hypothetical protein
LARVCAMFASEYSGERANAAAMADRIVRGDLGLTWETLFNRLTDPGHKDPKHERGIDQDRTDVEYCERGAQYLSDLDLDFLAGFLRRIRRGNPLTPKQRIVLDRMLQTVDGAGFRRRAEP